MHFQVIPGGQETKSESVSKLPRTHSQICQEGQGHEVRLRRISQHRSAYIWLTSYKCAHPTVRGRYQVHMHVAHQPAALKFAKNNNNNNNNNRRTPLQGLDPPLFS